MKDKKMINTIVKEFKFKKMLEFNFSAWTLKRGLESLNEGKPESWWIQNVFTDQVKEIVKQEIRNHITVEINREDVRAFVREMFEDPKLKEKMAKDFIEWGSRYLNEMPEIQRAMKEVTEEKLKDFLRRST